ncbi:hypothetical protein L2E82_13138 [Cichorium intybus]|uniref:Uncharacterized protein n=1 Tax=Cichorium intybus TaxID=13427 RepID=A0ACB9GJ12_CICIN|nr:hypothetical protein L2E82_13138 [Cichorium intybus]
MHLKPPEVEHFVEALLAGQFRLLRHLDISDKQGLASNWFIPIEQLLEQRPNFRLVAEFIDGSYVEYEQMSLNFMCLSGGSYNSDPGSGSEGD